MRHLGIMGVYVDGVRGKGYFVTCRFPTWEEANFANYRKSDAKHRNAGPNIITFPCLGDPRNFNRDIPRKSMEILI